MIKFFEHYIIFIYLFFVQGHLSNFGIFEYNLCIMQFKDVVYE